jgi:very-short-patch-repair endonuclease
MREREAVAREYAKRLRRTMTRAEALLWSYVRRRSLACAKFRRQHPIGPYIADFACVAAKLVVEIDGATHWTAEEIAHDARRTQFLEASGWRVLRVTNNDVYENLDGVWLTIESRIPPPAATPPPPP